MSYSWLKNFSIYYNKLTWWCYKFYLFHQKFKGSELIFYTIYISLNADMFETRKDVKTFYFFLLFYIKITLEIFHVIHF